MPLIYKATNISTNQCYVGYTCRSLAYRRREHLHASTPFGHALRNTPRAFRWEILYEGDDAHLQESIFIESQRAHQSCGGYNVARHGYQKALHPYDLWLEKFIKTQQPARSQEWERPYEDPLEKLVKVLKAGDIKRHASFYMKLRIYGHRHPPRSTH